MSNGTSSAAARRLKALARGPDDRLELTEAAILIGLVEEPGAEVEEVRGRLAAIAERARVRVPDHGSAITRAQELCAFLFDEEGFTGNDRAYYEIANSCIHRVLDRRLGIPISLSVILIEIGRLIGLPMAGVGFPTHFLVTLLDAPTVFVDAFHHGHILGYAECRALFEVVAGRVAFDERFLKPSPTRAILVRMLQNLKLVHLRAGEAERAIVSLDQILTLTPEATDSWRERGLLRHRVHDYGGAIEDLQEYLVRAPAAVDAPMVQITLADAHHRRRSIH
jgi:regulator of sirC expression with transglutaminase-like and TPR domain